MQTRVRIFLLWALIIFSVSVVGLRCRHFSQEIDPKKVSELEEYLINFSKKIEGYRLQTESLAPDLVAKRFFSILGESYILILCDKGSKMVLYKDHGSTITHVDFPYYREGRKVPCREQFLSSLGEVIEGYRDICDLIKLVKAMQEAGFSVDEVAAYMGGNFYQVLRNCIA